MTVIATAKKSAIDVHRETLRFLKSEHLIEGTSLALNVEDKLRRGQELNDAEADVLNHCITNRMLRVIRKHGL